MFEKIKRNLPYAFSALLGFLNFIFLAIPYASVFMSYGKEKEIYATVSGYNVIGWKGKSTEYDLTEAMNLEGFGAVLSSILTVLILVAGIALLAWGVCGLLKAFGVFSQFPSKLGKLESRKIASIGLIAFAGLQILLLLALILTCSANTQTEKTWMGTVTAGIQLGAGIFVSLIFAGGAVLANFLLEKYVPSCAEGEDAIYVCSGCGKSAKANDKFCTNCGGAIVKKVIVKRVFACSQCGKPATENDRFCTNCGGMIQEVVEKQYLCSQCGKPATENDRFCTNCGGMIQEAVEKQYFCSQCGKPASENDRFCTNCGGQIISR